LEVELSQCFLRGEAKKDNVGFKRKVGGHRYPIGWVCGEGKSNRDRDRGYELSRPAKVMHVKLAKRCQDLV